MLLKSLSVLKKSKLNQKQKIKNHLKEFQLPEMQFFIFE